MVESYLFATLHVRILSFGISFKIGMSMNAIYENDSNGGVTHSGEKVENRA
jgi:hypothetical protein